MFIRKITNWFSGRRQPLMSRRRSLTGGPVEVLEVRQMPAVNIVLDYSLDTKGFFSDTARRTLLDKAATMIESRLNDTLSAIKPSGSNTWKPSLTHPATGQSFTLPGSTSIAADTIVVYAGGRDLPGGTLGVGGGGGFASNGSPAWNSTVKGRSESGVLSTSQTDVAPWGGSITFDTTGVNWHFGSTTTGLDSNESDFLSVAMHELGHVMGLGTSKSWERLVSGGTFNGANARAEFGRNVPTQSGGGHFANDTQNDGLEAAMDPSITTGTRKLFGNLDFAALKDIGWEVNTVDDTIHQAQDQLAKPVADSGLIGGSDAVVFVGRMDNAKDVDIYRVFIGSGVKLSTSTFAPRTGTRIDTNLKLYDTGGTVLKTADREGGVGGTDSYDFTSRRADYYFIAVSSSGNRTYDPFRSNSGPGGTIGDYQIGITLT